MNFYIFENEQALNLEPITLTRPTFEVRCGALTCIERLQFLLPDDQLYLIVRKELEELVWETFPGAQVNPEQIEDGIWLLGNVLWDKPAIDTIKKSKNKLFVVHDVFVGGKLTQQEGQDWIRTGGPVLRQLQNHHPRNEIKVEIIDYLWNAVAQTATQMHKDVQFFNDYDQKNKNIFIHHSAQIGAQVVLDASAGPIIIAQDVKIKPFTYISGPVYIGENCTIEAMTHIKGGCSIGPTCKLGGEINSVVIQGWSNKVHEGHLGDAYLGQWVNLGAGTVNSNLKNNYKDIDVMVNGKLVATGNKHIGCFLGDHVKTAIGTKLNTGTVIGPGSNIATNGFPPKTVPAFSWCMNGKIKPFRWQEFLETAVVVKSRRGQQLTDAEIAVLESHYRGKKT